MYLILIFKIYPNNCGNTLLLDKDGIILLPLMIFHNAGYFVRYTWKRFIGLLKNFLLFITDYTDKIYCLQIWQLKNDKKD